MKYKALNCLFLLRDRRHSRSKAFSLGSNEDLSELLLNARNAEQADQIQAAFKLAEQKRVSFAPEQLAFRLDVDHTGMMAGEQPDPISIAPRGKKGQEKGRKRSTSAKKKAKKPMGAVAAVNKVSGAAKKPQSVQ